MTPKKNRRNQAIVSAPAPMTLGEGADAITILVRPPTPADLIALRQWCRSKAPPSQPQGLTSAELVDLSPEDRITLLREYAKAKADKRELSPEDMMALLHTPEGAAQMIWHAARRQHRDMTFEEVRRRINDDNVFDALMAFDEACQLDREDVIGEQDPKHLGPGSQ